MSKYSDITYITIDDHKVAIHDVILKKYLPTSIHMNE